MDACDNNSTNKICKEYSPSSYDRLNKHFT